MKLVQSLFWSRELKRLKVSWRVLIYLVLFTLTFILSNLVSQIFFGGGFFDNRNAGIFSNGLIYVLSTIGLIVFAARIIDRRSLTSYGFKKDTFFWSDIAVGVSFIIFVLGALTVLISMVAGWTEVTGSFETVNTSFAWSVVALLMFNFAVGLAEEVAFRGYILSNLMESFTRLGFGSSAVTSLAVVISSLLFMLFHTGAASGISLLYYFIFGVLFALTYLWTGNLIMIVAMHVTANLTLDLVFGTKGTSLLTLSETGVDTSLITGELLRNTLLLLILAAIALYIFFTRGSLRFRVRGTEPASQTSPPSQTSIV